MPEICLPLRERIKGDMVTTYNLQKAMKMLAYQLQSWGKYTKEDNNGISVTRAAGRFSFSSIQVVDI